MNYMVFYKLTSDLGGQTLEVKCVSITNVYYLNQQICNMFIELVLRGQNKSGVPPFGIIFYQ